MNLTNSQILALAQAIHALDGSHVVQVVEGKAVTVFKGFKIELHARWLLAQALGLLKTAVADFDQAKTSLIKQHTEGGNSIDATHPKYNAFAGEYQKLANTEVTLPLEKIPLAALQHPDNEIAIHVLNALAPILAS